MKKSLVVAGFFVMVISSFGQSGNFRTIASGAWGTAANWERDADSNGSFEESPATVPPSSGSGIVTIQNSHSINIAATITIDQVVVQSGGTLTIDAGVTCTLGTNTSDDINVNSGAILNVNGTIQMVAGLGGSSNKIRVTGTLNNNGSVLNSSNTKLLFEASSNYYHLFDGMSANTIPTAGWNVSSTVNITGIAAGGSVTPSGLSQSFGNFVWNSPNQDQFFDLAGAPSLVNGNFQVDDTGAGGFYWNQGGGLNTSLSIGGNLTINGGLVGLIGTTASTATATITGNLNLNGGYFQLVEDVNATVNIQGSLNIGGAAVLDFAAISATANINLAGNYNYSGGDINVTSGVGNLNFTGIGSINSFQTFTSSLTPVGAVNYTVSSLSYLFIPSGSFIGGPGKLTVSGNLMVGSVSASGALQTGSSAGNVRVTGARTYNSGSTVIYNGTSAQTIGNGHPTSTGVNTTINNSSGVSLIAGVPIIITTNLTLMSGNLNIGNGSLTLSGNLSAGSNNITIGSLGSITISGSGTIGTFPFPSGTQTFTNFTLDNPNGVTFGNNVVITGVVTLTDGILSFPSNTLSLSGTFAATGSGSLAPSSTSTFVIAGSGAFGEPRFDPSNNTTGTLTFSRSGSGTATLNSNIKVASVFNLNNGTLTNNGALTMMNGSTLNRGSNGSLSGTAPQDLPAGEYYHVGYSGSAITTGFELPTTALDNLGTLTVNGGPVTLDKNIIVHGNVNLQSSTLQAGTFNITMVGTSASWNKTSGSFSGGTGTLFISGNVTVTASTTPNFANITTNSGSSLTMYSGNTNVDGNLQLNSGSTFVANGGTITLNGGGNQTVSAAGKTINNLTINKSGGNVDLSTAINLIGILDIQTGTTVSSNGNLTLISNSSGTAVIGPILGGGSVSGNINAQRYFTNKGRFYRDISSPVLNPPVSNITASGITITGPFTGSSYPCSGCTTNNSSMFYYDESVAGAQTLGYVAFPSSGGNSTTTLLTRGRGYNLLLRNELGSPTMSLTGTLNSGTIPLPVSYTTTSGGSSEDGWNFVGNPYPCPVDWDVISGWSKANIQGNQISVYDPAISGYRVWNGTVGSLGNGRIASGQGFWVKFTGSPTLSINENAKTTTATTFYREKKKDADFIELILTGTGLEDRTYIQQIENGGSLNFDPNDGPKLMTQDGINLATLTDDNVKVSIQAVGEIGEGTRIPLFLSGLTAGQFTFIKNLSGAFKDVPVFIYDAHDDKYYDLATNYSFDTSGADADLFSLRYYLVIGRSAVVTGLDSQLSGLKVYPNPATDIMYVSVSSTQMPTGQVIDGMGKIIGDISWTEERPMVWKGNFGVHSLSAGVYFARVNLSGSSKVIKFIKK